jgi:hypothetical protein
VATTWYKDQEAVADGLADRIRGNDGDVRATWDMSVFNADAPGPEGDEQLGDGWVKGADGKTRYDPDGNGDDDSTAEGDTDHSHFDTDGKQTKAVPPKPGTKATVTPGAIKDTAPKKPDSLRAVAEVDNSAWDASKAWHNGTVADDPSAFYSGICAGKKTGDPDTQAAWALPYRYHPDDPPNAAGVRAALARLSQTQGLINKTEAAEMLEAAMKKINPGYKPGDRDDSLLSAVLSELLIGGTK